MKIKVFVAGATGVVGRRVVARLARLGYEVHGSTRRVDRARWLEALGARSWLLDIYDRPALGSAMAACHPDVVIHQLTDLPKPLLETSPGIAIERNARMRKEGTANLVGAAVDVGCSHLVAQSVAWVYADGPKPYLESQPLDLRADGDRGTTVRGVAALEAAVLGASSAVGTILRYGRFYGPGTGAHAAPAAVSVHVDAAADAAVRAVLLRAQGVFNICDPNPDVSSRRAHEVLGWSHAGRDPLE